MAVKWTEQQLAAIETHGCNLLVAAAAGSGKTAVLVERIIRMITDAENPVSVDRLLVLTFTEAAASEMKRKIADAIDRCLEENPDSEWLKEQSLRVGSACISTIHAFCSRILTNNAHLTRLPADFSLIDDTENKVLLAQALDMVLESYYERIDKKSGFRELVHGWGGIKGDESLREIILELHSFLRSLAYPKKWILSARRDGYDSIQGGKTLSETVWKTLYEKKLNECAQSMAGGLKMLWGIVEREVPTDHKYFSYYYEMMEGFCREVESLSYDDTYIDKLKAAIEAFEIRRAPVRAGLDEELVKRLGRIRDKIVKEAHKTALEIIAAEDDESLRRTAKCAPIVRTLCLIVRQTERVHQRFKAERGVIDFSDLEHGLLHLLTDGRGEETPLCRRLREYYHEILLDEFQDTNILQFEIFKMLSKPCGNLFMVGDVKQCIYKFRNADPSIFMQLYKAYDKGEGGQLIRLFNNFRSRREVVDSVNYVFSSVMSERYFGIDYTEQEYLKYGASYKDGDCYDTEVIITDTTEIRNEDDALAEFENNELEAQNAVSRIKELVCREKLRITDKETGELREVRYGDVTVLCRGSSGCNVVEEAFAKEGIATISETGRQYLDSIEVTTVLCFLQIIDNPLQDIPLIAVMRSPMFKFTADELAKIRAYRKKGRFYTALCDAAEEDKKAADFLSVLKNLRACAKYMGTDELVWKICNEQHYFSIVGAMPNGDLRRANLKLLLKRCSDFEQGSLTGLFNFMKYIEMLKDSGKDLAPAKELSASGDAVRIMTMHKSKGLEFPVVLLFGLSKKFNMRDIQRSIIWDERLGIGLDYVDTRQRVRFNVPIRKMIEDELLSELKAEEMRLLYVAMTRAKEKLIISSAITERENRWIDSEFDEDGRLYPELAGKIVCMRDWILSSLMNSPYSKPLVERAGRDDNIIPRINPQAVFKISIGQIGYNTESEATKSEKDTPTFTGCNINERLDYVYPYSKLGRLPLKLSVSELKRRRMPEEDYSTGLLKASQSIARTASEISAQERGTVTHYVLQHLDVLKTDSELQIKQQTDAMVLCGTLTKTQGEAVDVSSIYRFFSGELGQRLKASKRVEREFDFYMLIAPNELEEGMYAEGADDIILQGIADCFFYEADGIVLVDYKTDRVSRASAADRSEVYRMQIEYYARGLEDILGVPVKEKYIYFLNCGTAIKM